jgi:hypothetical protein
MLHVADRHTLALNRSVGRILRYCCYGPADGLPVVSLTGTPGTRWERPDVIAAIERAGLRVCGDRHPRAHTDWLLAHLPTAQGHE